VQPVLVDGGELVPQRPVEIFDDFGFALHMHSMAVEMTVGPTPEAIGWLEQF
jgi:hypothetical protein